MLRRSSLVILVALLVLAALPVSAGSDGGATFALGCDGFRGTGGSITLDRNNTGTLREAFIVSATDGVGNVIYAPVEDTFFVGGSVSWADGDIVPWTVTPHYNPLTVRVVSRAGNGFAEQLITQATGACETLPTFNALPEGAFVIQGGALTLGATSPEVPLNTTAPRPATPADVADQLAGRLIVNTDNLSLRSGDGVEYTLVGIVDGGTVLIPLGHNAKFSWWYVQAGDIVGWAKAQFLIARGDLTAVPVVEAQGEVATQQFFLFKDADLISAPSAGALPLCSIPGGMDYFITGHSASGKWFEIQATCNDVVVQGWIPADRGAERVRSLSG
jgi:uncharacterized protein YgiM (DUF1202 family)